MPPFIREKGIAAWQIPRISWLGGDPRPSVLNGGIRFPVSGGGLRQFDAPRNSDVCRAVKPKDALNPIYAESR